MPTYLQDGVGISGGSSLIGGTGSSEDLTLVSTSDSTKGSVFIAPSNDETVVAGRASNMPINSSANLFAGVTPKLEIQTGTASTSAYQDLVVIRHNGVDPSSISRRVGLLMKLSNETTYDPLNPTSETDKTGGMVLDTTNAYANFPDLSLITGNEKRITIDFKGTVTILGDLKVNGSNNITPTGSYIFMAVATAPAGYLRCDGSAVSRTTYAALFAVLGTTYGSGDGSTTFNLPDSRGMFFRDLDGGRGVDPSRALNNTPQGDTFQGHTFGEASGTYVLDRGLLGEGSSNVTITGVAKAEYKTAALSIEPASIISNGTNGTPRVGDETRSVNIAVVTFIKY